MQQYIGHQTFYDGRRKARETIVTQIYIKHYRRKLAAGKFNFSWVPNAAKFERIYLSSNERDKNTDKWHLVTINPGVCDDNLPIETAHRFLLDLLVKLRTYQRFLPDDATFCLEHRGDVEKLRGTHMHLIHDNPHGLCKSDFLRRITRACQLVQKDHEMIIITPQSIDIRIRPHDAANTYINKNRESDLLFGYGFQGRIDQDMKELQSKIEEHQRTLVAQRLASGDDNVPTMSAFTPTLLCRDEDGVPETPPFLCPSPTT